MKRSSWLMVVAVVLASATTASPAQGQIWKKVKEKVKARVDSAAEKAADAAVTAISCAINDAECIQKAQSAGKPVVVTDSKGKALPQDQQDKAIAAAANKTPNPGEGVWANYDFVPGERILFKEDFTSERVGNFPRRLEFVAGNAEVVEWNGGRWLRLNANPSIFAVPLPEVLPSRFTMEFQITLPWWGAIVYAGPDGNPEDPGPGGRKHSFVNIDCCAVGIKNAHGNGGSTMDVRSLFNLGDEFSGHLFTVRVQGDGNYLKMYLEEKRVANIPNADFLRTNKIYFSVHPAGDVKNVMIGNISINAGGTEMYEALLQNGRWATQGILFDVDSDHIRPESTPTLNDIADMLKSHADLKIRIEGHTDDTGAAAHNQTLSEQRAASVKAYLTSKGGIDAARIESQGFGASKPVKPNATPEGRQANRRVELVKI